MEVTRLRIVRHTRRFKAMAHFYQDVLEMRCVHQWDRPESQGALFSPGRAMGQTVIEVLDLKDHRPSRAKLSAVELGLEVRNVDVWYDRLRQRGVTIVKELADHPWGQRAFTIADPDGLPVTLYQEIG